MFVHLWKCVSLVLSSAFIYHTKYTVYVFMFSYWEKKIVLNIKNHCGKKKNIFKTFSMFFFIKKTVSILKVNKKPNY